MYLGLQLKLWLVHWSSRPTSACNQLIKSVAGQHFDPQHVCQDNFRTCDDHFNQAGNFACWAKKGIPPSWISGLALPFSWMLLRGLSHGHNTNACTDQWFKLGC